MNPATSGMDLIVTLVDYFYSLIAATERSVSAVVGSLDLPWVMFTFFVCFNRWFQAISISFMQNLIFIFHIEEHATPVLPALLMMSFVWPVVMHPL